SLAIAAIPDKKDPKQDPLPELHLVPAKGGGGKVIARNVGVLFRWFGDSRRMLVFEISKKDENSRYFGNIGILDTTTGKITSLAAAAVTQQFFMDLSPDNTKALFTALRTAEAGVNLEKGNDFKAKLCELDIATGNVRKTEREASYAIYSPDGKKV